MSHPDPGSAREEAERLVAAALAMVGRFANNTDPRSGHEGPKMATGADECCVCPICRTIAAMRDPDPDFTERLAAGAGDLAAGVASLLRSFSAPAGPRPWQTPEQSPPPAEEKAPPAPPATGGPAPAEPAPPPTAAGPASAEPAPPPTAAGPAPAEPAPPPTAGPAPAEPAPPPTAPGSSAPEDTAAHRPGFSAPSDGPGAGIGSDPADVWRAATRTGDDVDRPADADVWSAATSARPTKPMARKAVKKAAPRTPPPDDDD
jgi:hypothetical protein